MRVLPRRLPLLLLPATENYGNSLTCAEAPHLFGGWAEYLYLRPGTPVFQVPEGLPTNVAVLTELFAVTHSLDLAAKMPRPGGFRAGDTVAVVGIGPVGIVHVAKASLMGASRVIAIDPFGPRALLRPPSSVPPTRWIASGADPRRRRALFVTSPVGAESTWSSTPRAIRRASVRHFHSCVTAER